MTRNGSWTRETLELIAAKPAVRAGDLAQQLGQERLPFKANVRKLKALGLTESLEVGYRLSPRGRAFLAASTGGERSDTRLGSAPHPSRSRRARRYPPQRRPGKPQAGAGTRMINRWMAVVLGAAVLAVPGTALAKGDHAKGHGKEKAERHQKAEKHGKKDKQRKKDKAAKKPQVLRLQGRLQGRRGRDRQLRQLACPQGRLRRPGRHVRPVQGEDRGRRQRRCRGRERRRRQGRRQGARPGPPAARHEGAGPGGRPTRRR